MSFWSANFYPSSHPSIEPQEQDEYLVGGEIKHWTKGQSQRVVSPIRKVICNPDGNPESLEEIVIGSYPMMDSAAALSALNSSKEAYDDGLGVWPMMRLEDRIGCISKFTRMMEDRRDQIVDMICLEICKTVKDARGEFDRTVQYIKDTIESVKQTDRNDSKFVYADGIVAQVRRSPLGIALCMGPYNYPLNETFTTLIPALIMGNVVIFKPPRIGVLLLRPLIECFKESFPPGVVNTVYGDGETIVKPIMSDGSISILNFIGSKRAAKAIIDYHPDKNRLLCVLGLQAKNAGIVLPCADLDVAVEECVKGALKFNGQRCTALKIIFVHKRVADAFLSKFCAAVDNLKIGMPWDEDVSITPLADGESAITYLKKLVYDACWDGASVANPRGNKVDATLMTPTVIAWAKPQMRLWKEEQFGPVVPVATFGDGDDMFRDVVEYHASSGYGQQASIFGRDASSISQLVDMLSNQVSRINLNCECQRGPDILPFTGRKDSATGTLSVSDAPKVMSIRRVAAAKDNDANRAILQEIVRRRMSKSLSTDWLF